MHFTDPSASSSSFLAWELLTETTAVKAMNSRIVTADKEMEMNLFFISLRERERECSGWCL